MLVEVNFVFCVVEIVFFVGVGDLDWWVVGGDYCVL